MFLNLIHNFIDGLREVQEVRHLLSLKLEFLCTAPTSHRLLGADVDVIRLRCLVQSPSHCLIERDGFCFT